MDRPAAPYTLHEPLPLLDAPVLVAVLTGWIDASGAAAGALATVAAACDVRPLVTFDGDVFIDYRARRPTMELRDGVNERIVWPEISLQVGRAPDGTDVLVLTGPEPDSAWRTFATAVADLAHQLGVSSAVFLGAYPFATPHTRPSRLSSSSPSRDVIEGLAFLRNSVDVPAGVSAVLEHSIADVGITAVGIWAQVPHYLGTMGYPAASVALLDGLHTVTGLTIDATLLRTDATLQRERIDQLVVANPEHQGMVSQLETIYDDLSSATFAQPEASFGGAELPSGDELAAEFERFLRDQDD
ncbi:MAG: PAC2 family protein [Ilumatobacteraceae bacterium]